MQELVKKAKHGDREAFAELYSSVSRKLYSTAFYLLGRKEDAEDLVMDTVTDAFRTISLLRDDSAFERWILRILINKAKKKRGNYINVVYIDPKRVNVIYELPLSEIVYDFFDKLKSYTKGYASFDYEFIGNKESKLVKLDILLNRYKLNTNICIIEYLDKDLCIKENKYLVDKTYSLNNALNLKNKISSGDIIFIEDNMALSNFKVLLKELKYRDIKIDFLSNLISEKRESLS